MVTKIMNKLKTIYVTKRKAILSCLLSSIIIFTTTSHPHAQTFKGKPGLLLTPTRVVIEGKKRGATVNITNNGSAIGTYKISLSYKAMDEKGSLSEKNNDKNIKDSATSFLRIAPRRVVLAPGEYQVLRVLARKPSKLPDGEYRAHLRAEIVPDKKSAPTPAADEKQTLSISVQSLFGFSIPIIVLNGDVKKDASIESVALKYKNNKPHAVFNIERTGNASPYGDIEVLYKSASGKEYVLKNMRGIAVYTSVNKRTFDLPLEVPKDVTLGKGTLTVTYENKDKDGGYLISKKTINL